MAHVLGCSSWWRKMRLANVWHGWSTSAYGWLNAASLAARADRRHYPLLLASRPIRRYGVMLQPRLALIIELAHARCAQLSTHRRQLRVSLLRSVRHATDAPSSVDGDRESHCTPTVEVAEIRCHKVQPQDPLGNAARAALVIHEIGYRLRVPTRKAPHSRSAHSRASQSHPRDDCTHACTSRSSIVHLRLQCPPHGVRQFH